VKELWKRKVWGFQQQDSLGGVRREDYQAVTALWSEDSLTDAEEEVDGQVVVVVEEDHFVA